VVATNLKRRRMYNLTMPCGSSFIDLIKIKLMEAILTGNHGNVSVRTNGQDK
jgi:hypothetical protein